MSNLKQEDTAAAVSEEAGDVKKKHWARWTILAVVVLALAGTAIWAFLPQPDTETSSTRQMMVTAEKGTQTQNVTFAGTLLPQRQAELNFSVSGTVKKVYVKVGDTVAKGAKLAAVDSKSLQNAVDLAQANLTSAEADYDDISSSGTSAAKKAASARVDSAKASLDSAKDDLKNAVLRATIAGTIAQVDLEVGDQVTGSSSGGSGSSGNSGGSGMQGIGASTGGTDSSSEAQVLVVNTKTWKVSGSVTASDLALLKSGQSAQVTPDSAQEPLAGKVSAIGVVASSSSDGSATFPVEINIDGDQSGLYSGTNADVNITVAEYPDVLTVPSAAISNQGTQAQVNVMKNGETVAKDVTLGRVFGQQTEITAGLEAGDQVVITLQSASGATDSQPGFQFGGGMAGPGGLGGLTGGGRPPGMGSGQAVRMPASGGGNGPVIIEGGR